MLTSYSRSRKNQKCIFGFEIETIQFQIHRSGVTARKTENVFLFWCTDLWSDKTENLSISSCSHLWKNTTWLNMKQLKLVLKVDLWLLKLVRDSYAQWGNLSYLWLVKGKNVLNWYTLTTVWLIWLVSTLLNCSTLTIMFFYIRARFWLLVRYSGIM